MVMLIIFAHLSTKRILQIESNFQYISELHYYFDGHWSLHIYKFHVFITNPVLPSILEILPSIPEKWGSSSKMANFDAQKNEYEGQKKRHSPNPYWHGLLAKNQVQIGQFWPPWPPVYFTDAYRGSPPCTLSHHPDNRETGYSNVLCLSLMPLCGIFCTVFAFALPLWPWATKVKFLYFF